jgi:hypothetical protein
MLSPFCLHLSPNIESVADSTELDKFFQNVFGKMLSETSKLQLDPEPLNHPLLDEAFELVGDGNGCFVAYHFSNLFLPILLFVFPDYVPAFIQNEFRDESP